MTCIVNASKRMGKDRGFTLIEVLIVIILLSLLATIFVPSGLRKVRTEAAQRFADELVDVIESAKRIWLKNIAEGNYPACPSLNDALTPFAISQTEWLKKVRFMIQNLSWQCNTGTPETLTITLTFKGNKFDKYAGIINNTVPFSQCSNPYCDITITADEIPIDREIQGPPQLVCTGETISCSCAGSRISDYSISPVKLNPPEGFPLTRYSFYENGGVLTVDYCYWVHSSLYPSGGFEVCKNGYTGTGFCADVTCICYQ